MTNPDAEKLVGEWGRVIRPIAIKFELAHRFNADAVFNSDGAEACGKLLREMARIIDGEIVARAQSKGEAS